MGEGRGEGRHSARPPADSRNCHDIPWPAREPSAANKELDSRSLTGGRPAPHPSPLPREREPVSIRRPPVETPSCEGPLRGASTDFLAVPSTPNREVILVPFSSTTLCHAPENDQGARKPSILSRFSPRATIGALASCRRPRIDRRTIRESRRPVTGGMNRSNNNEIQRLST